MMLSWPHTVKPMTKEEILSSTADSDWQSFRVTMKGMTTSEKLDRLSFYRMTKLLPDDSLQRVHEVQIDNYINALKRGGQLNSNLGVVK